VGIFALAGLLVLGTSASNAAPKPVNIAFLSFAVANSYDSPMLAAAQAVARANGYKITVFDANNDPAVQYSQLQNVISSGKYQGVLTQPIFGAGLAPLVEKAIKAKIKVVNIDQILGTSYTTDQPQVKGLSGNVTFLPSKIGKQLGEQAVAACKSKSLTACKIGYIYSIKASTLDAAIEKGFNAAIAGSGATVVAEGESFFQIGLGLAAVQNMLQAQPGINVIVGADQGIQGAAQALAAAKNTSTLLVGFGGSATAIAGVKAGTWFSNIYQAPASTGELGMQALVKAIKTGKSSGGINPIKGLPNDGVITKANASKFTGEWVG
jgi:ribose transport system substrate-binding protein